MSKLLIGGKWVDGGGTEKLKDKYSGVIYGEMAIASAHQVKEAVSGAVLGFEQSTLSPYDRYKILSKAAQILETRIDLLGDLMRMEAGFTKADGENEARRCIQTLELSSEEAKRLSGDLVPMEAAQGVKNRIGFTIRSPRGVVCAITPFNSPLNTVAHKVGPALAGGNSVIIKPSEFTPLTAVELCKILIEAGLPSNLISLVHGEGQMVGRQLLADPRIAFYAFTGSTRVGREIQAAAGLRKTQLELGSIASTIVCEDANIILAIPKILNAGFRKAGQVCTSVQRLYVSRAIAGDFIPQLVAATKQMKFGDPSDSSTIIGPMISQKSTDRAMAWVKEAIANGAQVLTGGAAVGPVMEPTILSNVSGDMKVVCEEIFAPVISIIEFDTLEEAIKGANGSPFGLAAGIFTNDLHNALSAAKILRFGGVHINEASSSRIDVMPFGGVKDSGFGWEGPAYAIREMTEERLVTISY